MEFRTPADHRAMGRVRLLAREHIPVGADNLVGEEHRPGVVLQVGAAGPIGTAARGYDGRTTAPSLQVWRSARSSPLPPSATSRLVRIPACAGIGPTPTGRLGTGTIAEL
jgi:hypothetical protein